jgi:hypothetical protein
MLNKSPKWSSLQDCNALIEKWVTEREGTGDETDDTGGGEGGKGI